MSSFYQKFFRIYSNFIGKESEWPLLDDTENIILVKASENIVVPNEFPDFLPCYCDAGHPILSALGNHRECICSGPTYLKVLARSDIAVSSLLVRIVGLYCINGHKIKTIGSDASVAQASLSCRDKKYQ